MAMSPVQRAERIRACVMDLRGHGIDLVEMPERDLWRFVRQNREYFHHMLGYEPRDREIVHLVRRVTGICPVDDAYVMMTEMRSRRMRTGRGGRSSGGRSGAAGGAGNGARRQRRRDARAEVEHPKVWPRIVGGDGAALTDGSGNPITPGHLPVPMPGGRLAGLL